MKLRRFAGWSTGDGGAPVDTADHDLRKARSSELLAGWNLCI
jgi:hypothetical protein